MRVYSDEELPVGESLELELLLVDDTTVRCWARVAWVEKLQVSEAARFDIGLEFTDMADTDRRLLTAALAGV
jgi:PilZ domain